MKRSDKKPGIYKKLKKQFGISWEKGIIITVGDTIHCKQYISRIKYIHEKVHGKQQREYGVEEWWKYYLKDSGFRLEQEIEAYKAEIEYAEFKIRDIEKRYKIFGAIAKDLSSSMYGNMISFGEAVKVLFGDKVKSHIE